MSIITNSVPKPADTVDGADIVTMFTPQGNDPSTGQPWTLAAAAQACGFFAWDWQQTVTSLPQPTPDSLLHEVGSPNEVTIPVNDPPPRGWVYQTPCPPHNCDVPGIAVYWDPFPTHTNAGPYALAAEVKGNQLLFGDAPGDICLPTGPQSAAVAAKADQSKANGGCGGPGVRAPTNSVIKFTTHLVGLQGSLSNVAIVDTGIGFDWTANFNGTVGGNSALFSTGSADPGSGTGGNTVTNFNGTPTYNGIAVTGVNGSPSGPSALLAAVLPVSRSVQVNNTATVFATIINSGTTTASACSIAPIGGLPLTSLYQTTNPATNALTGTDDTPVDIPAGGSQSFVIALTPTATIAPTDVQFSFACSNANPAPINIGLTTLLLSGSASLTPDVVALAATATNDGTLHLPGASGTAAFATATVNVGAGGTITASTNTGSAMLPLTLTICQSNPANGQCLAPPAASVMTTINANATPTFSIFGTASGAIPFDPANSRVFVTFSDSGNAVRGETSVAVETQ
jgi:hypothetical protein